MTTTSENKRGSKAAAAVVPSSNKRMSASRNRSTAVDGKARDAKEPDNAGSCSAEPAGTAISCCVQDELVRYFDMLDGEKPSGLYRMVIRQAEHALLSAVMRECGGNQSRAAEWLGISRGNLRNKLADMD